MSTFEYSISGRRPTVSKLDQSDDPFVCKADHAVTVDVKNSVPERSVLDQKDDYVAPTVEEVEEESEQEEEAEEEDD